MSKGLFLYGTVNVVNRGINRGKIVGESVTALKKIIDQYSEVLVFVNTRAAQKIDPILGIRRVVNVRGKLYTRGLDSGKSELAYVLRQELHRFGSLGTRCWQSRAEANALRAAFAIMSRKFPELIFAENIFAKAFWNGNFMLCQYNPGTRDGFYDFEYADTICYWELNKPGTWREARRIMHKFHRIQPVKYVLFFQAGETLYYIKEHDTRNGFMSWLAWFKKHGKVMSQTMPWMFFRNHKPGDFPRKTYYLIPE